MDKSNISKTFVDNLISKIEYLQTTFLGCGGGNVDVVNEPNEPNEPIGYNLLIGLTKNSNIMSEPWMELSSTGRSKTRPMYHYVTTHETIYIKTPPDTYSPDKVSQDIIIENFQQLQQLRNQEVPVNTAVDRIKRMKLYKI
jgi:hypothetical protein